MSQQTRLVFSFDKDEIMPTFLGWGHGLKEENMCFWETISCEKTEDSTIKEYTKKALYKDAEVYIFLKFIEKNGYDTLEKGVAKVGDKECVIIDLRSYYSLQIGQYCYDNISVIKLPYNIFDSAGMSANGTSSDSGLKTSRTTGVANVMTAPEISC
jgi:hypothetical protein